MGAPPLDDAQLRAACDALAGARRVLAITGAGISADSGVPTYRGVGGLYEGRPTDDGVPIDEALSGPVFRRDPALTWRYLHQIEAACRGARPNAGHRVLAAMQARFEAVVVLTQNVDGLHRAAGSRDVIDIHGDFHDLSCTGCDHAETVQDYRDLAPLPRCPGCGGVLRPAVILFEEMLPMDKLARLQLELVKGFDVVLSIGTSSLFPYIAAPVLEARRRGRPSIEINPGTSGVSDLVDLRIPAGAAAALSAIWRHLGGALEEETA